MIFFETVYQDKLRDVLRHLKLKDLVKTANKSADLEDPNDAGNVILCLLYYNHH